MRPVSFRARWRPAAAAILVAVPAGCTSKSAPATPTRGATGGTDKPITVDVVSPQAGGLARYCTQPGTVEPFESADLYAKVSGFLAEQSVDIGSRVKRGQVLARIAVPEFDRDVDRATAAVADAKAKVRQAEAHLVAIQAEAKAARAQIDFAQSDVRSKTAFRTFRKKEFDRLKDLLDQQAIDAKVVDEKGDQYESSVAGELAAQAAVVAARQQAEAADAKAVSAQADIDEAKANVLVTEADLAKAKVWQDYTVITSPYDGVITKRTFFRGDFIRAAEAGASRSPLLSVDRTDLMRVVVPVPDRDVPYVTVGDPAALQIDALPGRTFNATVSRFADAEDASTRTMRTEIDVPNPDGLLKRGLFGRCTITLEAGAKTGVRIPSAALVGKSDGGRATVRVVKDGKAETRAVTITQDTGVDVGVASGLEPTDLVIVRSGGVLQDGTPVEVNTAK
jgi:RND family efflux transporter MFP subunit